MMNFRYLLLLSSALFLFACENEVELLEDAAPVPIVYGLYNAAENEQFVSISKSFLFGEEGGARAAAQQEDSLYYGIDEIVAFAENSASGARSTMRRVNLADQGMERRPGVFPSDPNYFYTYDASGLNLEPGDTLKMMVEKNGAIIASGSAPVLPQLEFQAGREPLDRYPFSSQQPFTFRWTVDRSSGVNVDIGTYEFGFTIFITETGPDGDVEREFYWAAGRNLEGNRSVFSGRIDGFYDYLNGELEQSLDGFSYSVPQVKLVVTGGDDSFNAYQELINANRGITSTGELPPFSNVEGAIGLFGGITQITQVNLAGLTPDAADALVTRCPGIDFGL